MTTSRHFAATRAALTLFAMAMVLFAMGCGDEAMAPPYVIQIQPTDVVQPAVHEVRVQLRPIGHRFEGAGARFDNGNARTFVSPEGWYVVEVNQAWITDFAITDQETLRDLGASSFILEIPLEPGGNVVEDVRGLELVVDFVRNGNIIARGGTDVPWPIPEGITNNVKVACNRNLYSAQCVNNAP